MIERCSVVKDLYDNLSFRNHIATKATESLKVYGFCIRNCRQFNNVTSLKILYFTYVKSKLEYACIIWNPIQIETNMLQKL